VAGIISVLFALTLLLFIFFIVYSLFGGWDDFSLSEFRRAMEMSGPSKPFVKLIYKLSEYFARLSPLHNRFPIRSDESRQEAIELMLIKERKEIELAAEKAKQGQ
ncbi:MAG: hypothetical protein JW839_20845, partial [Candidatus Lokiarchaeota archaeon]|nr:hypothetical protein [Candidatus Lokiarchaeota archaeon]